MRRGIAYLITATVVLAFGVLAFGCGGDICGSERLPTCDIRELSCQALVQDEVRCMRGAATETLPPVSILTVSELEAHLRAGADPSAMRMRDWQGALQLLRLLGPGVDLFEESIATSRAGILAFYSMSERTVYVIDRGMPADSVDAVAMLAHELVHAAQDEEHDLSTRFEAARTHEELMLLRGIVEGEATLYTYEAYVWSEGHGLDEVDWRRFYGESIDGMRGSLDATSSPYFVIYGQLPYLLGARWQTQRWNTGGDTLVRGGVPGPPYSSAWLMVDPWGGGRTPPPRASAVCDPPAPPDGFDALAPDEMGASLVYAFLRRWEMTHAEAWDLALRWRRDDLNVYGAPDGRVALAWRIVFDDVATPRWTASQIEGRSELFRAGYAEDTVVLLTSDDPALTAAWTWDATSSPPSCAPPP